MSIIPYKMTQERQTRPLPRQDQNDFQSFLSERYEHVPDYLRTSNMWQPFVHSEAEQEQFYEIQRALQMGLRALVGAMYDDVRLQRLVGSRLAPDVLDIFANLDPIVFEEQFVRPDYIYSPAGLPLVCEVNTRFIFNGNIAAVHAAEYFARNNKADTTSYERLNRFLHTTYDAPGEQIGYVSLREPEHDILFQKQRSERTVAVETDNIRGVHRRVGRLVLELHQDELDVVLPELAIEAKHGVRMLNDLRVIHFLHDKRLLVPLSDDEYMSGLIGPDMAGTLTAAIVPSYHPQWEGREPETISAKQALAKGALSGKSNDQMMVRRSTYKAQLEKPNNYVYQPRIVPPKITVDDGTHVEVAGTLPMTIDGEVFGPGLVRIGEYNRLWTFRGITVAMQEAG